MPAVLVPLLLNWRTTAAGVAVIGSGLLKLFGIEVPGFSIDPGTALVAGLGLVFGKDAVGK